LLDSEYKPSKTKLLVVYTVCIGPKTSLWWCSKNKHCWNYQTNV